MEKNGSDSNGAEKKNGSDKPPADGEGFKRGANAVFRLDGAVYSIGEYIIFRPRSKEKI